MKHLLLYIFMFELLLVSCTFQDEPAVCPFNVRLEYWYAGYAYENRLPVRVDNLREYLYDGSGNLVQTKELRGDSLTGYQATLPPGDYTLVAWGNLENKASGSLILSENNKIQNTTLCCSPYNLVNNCHANTERLYYGSASFTVPPSGVVNQRVYVSHAHANLKITVYWRIPRPDLKGTLRMHLRTVPSEYGFWVGHDIPASNGAGPHLIPYINDVLADHETRAAVDYNDDVIGEFVTHRFTGDTHPLWSLSCNGTQIVKELDLQRYFKKSSIDLDHNVEQEFHLLVIIEENQTIVTEISGTDWDEGGVLG